MVGGSGAFYIMSLPGAGSWCVQNAVIAVAFSREPDLATLNGRAQVKKKSDNVVVPGRWSAGAKKSIALFTPEGSCAPVAGNNCLEQNTDYRLEFSDTAKVRAADNGPALNCSLKAGCGPVEFKSGAGIDREPPQLNFSAPAANSSVQSGTIVPATIAFTDDQGIQQISLYQ